MCVCMGCMVLVSVWFPVIWIVMVWKRVVTRKEVQHVKMRNSFFFPHDFVVLVLKISFYLSWIVHKFAPITGINSYKQTHKVLTWSFLHHPRTTSTHGLQKERPWYCWNALKLCDCSERTCCLFLSLGKWGLKGSSSCLK